MELVENWVCLFMEIKDRNRTVWRDGLSRFCRNPKQKNRYGIILFQLTTELFDRAQKIFPSGSTRQPFYRTPYPLYAKFAQGCYIWDEDGNEFVDFVNNMGPLILGHRHPAVEKAVLEQVGAFWCGAPTELEIRLAEMILKEYPMGDRLVFCPSGTEAMMKFIRAARSASGKKKIAMASG